MNKRRLRCGLLGGQEADLTVLSELHRQEDLEIGFVYDRKEGAVGLEIAEIMGIPALHAPEQLSTVAAVTYVVVSEPREMFADELKRLTESGAKILTPSRAISFLCGREYRETQPTPADAKAPYTIEDTLVALERLLNRKELLKFLLEVAVKATNSSTGSIMMYSPEAEELYIAYATGLSERVVKRTRQKLGEGIAGEVALSKEAQLLRLPPDRAFYTQERERVDIASAISVPLMWAGELLGVLNVSSGRRGHEHGERDLESLKALSRRLSRVLSESRKIEQVQVRHREARFRSTMGELAAKEVAAQEKLSILAGYLAELLGAETAEIFLHTPEGDWFVLGGSNRVLTPSDERVRVQRGALNRAYLERRCLVLTEGAPVSDDPLQTLSSVAYCHVPLIGSGGVVALEFAERHRLDEFLLIRDAIMSEVARFISFELRARKLRREVNAHGKISDGAAALLGCRSVDELGGVLSRVVADVLECRRVSVRFRSSADDEDMHLTVLGPPGDDDANWQTADEKRFERLQNRREPFSLAFLSFDVAVRSEPADYQSLLAFPIRDGDALLGGIIAYEKHPKDPLEDAIFTELDETVLDHICRLIMPVLETIREREPTMEAGPAAWEGIVEANLERFRIVSDSEITRADRYHHSFAVVLFEVDSLASLFDQDAKAAFRLVEEITQGIRTRTRKTDYGAWIDGKTYAMLSLEGGKRVRFLVSRAMLYLGKDLTSAGVSLDDVRVGTATYPGTSRSAEQLIDEARAALKPYSKD